MDFQAWKIDILANIVLLLLIHFDLMGVKLTIVEKPWIPTNIPFYGSMYEP